MICAMSSRAVLPRLTFAACAILVSLGLSFRHIPTDADPNDTGRYVGNQLQACALPASGDSSVTHDSSVVLHSHWGTLPAAGDPSITLPMRAFNLLMRPACLGGNPRLFLFWAAMAVPAALLLFANWNREGTLLVAGGMLISTVGFEFMTNALRQGVGIAFLLGGFYFQNRFAKLAACFAAILLHDSNWFFAPLAVLLAYATGGLSMKTMLRWGIPMLAVAGYLFSLRFFSSFDLLSTAVGTYTERYAVEASLPFLLFIISPLVLVFLIRRLDRGAKASKEERITFWYSTAILTLSIVIFPAITYRFAMTATSLQVFMAMRSCNLSLRSGGLIACGLVAHFMIYVFLAKNVMAMFYG
jgi:hypothetical protein